MLWYWIFYKEKTKQFLILTDDQVTGEVRWQLRWDGYEVLWDSARSYQDAAQEAKSSYNLKPLRLETQPISWKEACRFVDEFHRHHTSPQGQKFSIALYDGDIIVGVIMAGRPVSRHQDDGLTLEVTRCCVKEPYKNGVSKLYSAVFQVAKAMGYKQVITYTLTNENGSSMKASNFHLVGKTDGGSWSRKGRTRKDKHPTEPKYLWLKTIQ